MAAATKYVPVKFPVEVFEALVEVARADRELWYDHGPVVGEQPCVSMAVRQLVNEALAARGLSKV